MEDVLGVIRDVVLGEAERLGVGVERIILFGSRARGDARGDSDYDILVVVEDCGARLVRRLRARIYRALGDRGVYADVVVVEKSALDELRGDPGFVYYTAMREGVPV